MTTGARILGNLIDIGTCFAPVDMQTGTNTGKRISLNAEQSITFVLFKAVGTAGDDPVITLQQHTASVSGTSTNLAVVTKFYKKSEATLDNDEVWVETTQAASQTVTLTGEAALQGIYVIEVSGSSLAAGNGWVSMNVADVGGNAQLGGALYIVRPNVGRKPAQLPNLLTGDYTANV